MMTKPKKLTKAQAEMVKDRAYHIGRTENFASGFWRSYYQQAIDELTDEEERDEKAD